MIQDELRIQNTQCDNCLIGERSLSHFTTGWECRQLQILAAPFMPL